LFKALFDALVLVTQTLLQAQYTLTDDRKTKVSRLDGAGVYRADGDFMHAVACDLNELISVYNLFFKIKYLRNITHLPLAQWKYRRWPRRMAQPLALIHRGTSG
jgi:hypothetical protein